MRSFDIKNIHMKRCYGNLNEKFGTSRIYDIMVSFQNAKFDENRQTKYQSHWNFNGYSELGFMLNIDDLQSLGGFHINIDYQKDGLSDEEVEKIYARFCYIIEQVLLEKEIFVKDVEIVTKKEKQKILYEFNQTKKDYPKEKRLFDALEQRAKETPNKIALCFEGKTMTYQEMNQKVNALAHYLIEQKVPAKTIVAIMLERSFDMLISIYAVLKVGCSYMPVDPYFPVDRIQFMLEDSEAPVILTHTKWKTKLITKEGDEAKTGKEIYLDQFDYGKGNKENPNRKVSSQDIAYVIYTSGSTGKPKGAQIQHHSVINRIQWMHEKYPLKENDVILQKTPYTFDVSVWELFWWSLYGGSLQILLPEGHKDPKEIIDTIFLGKVTHIHFVPSMLNSFLDYLDANPPLLEKVKSLSYVFASGEALQSEHVKKFYRLFGAFSTTLHNLYGPTECTVDVSYYDCIKDQIPESIPIGKPVDNTELCILDKEGGLLPIGASGELVISGVLVGKGYIKREELTREKFIPNRYFQTSLCMYKTGDLAKWLPDGNIEYLGRMDHQVKIRGLRVELGDIETAILKFPSVLHCVVTVLEEGNEKYLCGYFTAKKTINQEELKKQIAKELPDYMVPSYFIQLEQMPLNHNGKIDRKALPKPDTKVEEEYIAPNSPLEKEIQLVVESVLKRDNISVETDLLTVGLTSLGVITVITKLSMQGILVKVRDFYEHHSIREIASFLEKGQDDSKEYQEDVAYRDISDISSHATHSKEQGDILLTGVTGFLGIHLLQEIYNLYVKEDQTKVYCLIRNEKKFFNFVKKYTTIPEKEICEMGQETYQKIIFIKGDITKENLGLPEDIYRCLKQRVNQVVHSAANVSFFCSFEKAKAINYIGTCNIIQFAKESEAKLHHISTMSVSGDILTSQSVEYPQFNENTLYIGQMYKENVYAHSKYLAEKEIIQNIRENTLNASIYRLPNLTWRMKDGLFQPNYQENDLYMMTKVMCKLKKVPMEIKNENILLTPADDLAKAIVLLMKKEKQNKVYHLVSSSSPTIEQYIECLEEVTYLPMQELYKELREKSCEDEEIQFVAMYLAGIAKDAEKQVVHVHDEQTAQLLKNYGFIWGKIDKAYIKKFEEIGQG